MFDAINNIDREVERIRNEEHCGPLSDRFHDDDPFGIYCDDGPEEETKTIDLREHKDLIRELVAKEAEKDPNWKWSVKSIGKTIARIRWGYLEYIGEKGTFSITIESYDDCLGETVTWRHPCGEMISFATIGNRPGDNAESVQQAIEMAVRGIARYAHSRY